MRLDDYDKQIMKVVKNLRSEKGLKQFVVADALSVDRSVYCRIENGEATFSTSQLKLISNVLGVSLHQILFLAENCGLDETELETRYLRFKTLLGEINILESSEDI